MVWCIDVMEILLRLLMGKFRQFLIGFSAHKTIVAGHYPLTFFFFVLFYFLNIIPLDKLIHVHVCSVSQLLHEIILIS